MSTALALLASLGSLTSAAPAALQPEARQVFTTIAFIGAADGIFYLTEPVNGSSFPICKHPLSHLIENVNFVSAVSDLWR